MALHATPDQDLLLAVVHENYEEAMAKALRALNAGAHVTAQDEFGNTALYRAIRQSNEKNEKLALLLIDRALAEAREEVYPFELFANNVEKKKAMNEGNERRVAELFSNKIDLANHNGETPLIKATCLGLTKIMEKLIQSGANVQAVDLSKWHLTPLLHAIREDQVAAVKLLLKHSAWVDFQDKDRTTPLSYASYRGQVESVKELLKYGADVTLCDKKDRNALQYAVMGIGNEEKKLDTVKLLLKHGTPVNTRTHDSGGALSQAAYRGQIGIMNELIKKGALIDEVDEWDNTPLHYAVRGNRVEAVKLLLKKGADISRKARPLNDRKAPDITIFDGAVITGNQEIIQLIINAAQKAKNADIMKEFEMYKANPRGFFEFIKHSPVDFGNKKGKDVWVDMTEAGGAAFAAQA